MPNSMSECQISVSSNVKKRHSQKPSGICVDSVLLLVPLPFADNDNNDQNILTQPSALALIRLATPGLLASLWHAYCNPKQTLKIRTEWRRQLKCEFDSDKDLFVFMVLARGWAWKDLILGLGKSINHNHNG